MSSSRAIKNRIRVEGEIEGATLVRVARSRMQKQAFSFRSLASE